MTFLTDAWNSITECMSPKLQEQTDENTGNRYLVGSQTQKVIKVIEGPEKPPTHIKEQLSFSTFDSFKRYIGIYGSAQTLVGTWQSSEGFRAGAVIDYHDIDATDYTDHKAALNINPSREYNTVTRSLVSPMSQKSAVQYLDSIVDYIRVPEGDSQAASAAIMTRLVRDLSITCNSEANMEVDSAGDATNISYKSSKKTNIFIPEYFVVVVKPFDESVEVGIKIQMTTRVEEGAKGVTLTFRAPALDKIWNDEIRIFKSRLFDECSDHQVYETDGRILS